MENTTPDYKRIYTDIIKMYPDKMKFCESILKKQILSPLDIIRLNNIIFEKNNSEAMKFNQQHKAYDLKTIIEILTFQKQSRLNNTQIAEHFKLSRNTIAKWKSIHKI